MKTLVTGGSGLIGSQFKGDRYFKASSKDCDLRDTQETEDFITKGNYDSVIHTAARVGGLGANMAYKGEFLYDNVLMNTNVIEASRKVGVKKMVAFLSTCVFPDDVEYPLTPDKIHLGEPHNSNYPYAYAKRLAEVQVRAYNEQYNLDYKCVIPTNVYGPNDNYHVDNGHVIPSLIHKCYLARENNEDLHLWGDGKPMREFIFSKDVADLTQMYLDTEETDPLILSTSKEYAIKDVVEMIVELFKFKGKLIWDTDKPNGQMRKPSDNSKAKELFPDYQFTDLYDGLKESIEWFEKNYPNIRTV